MRFCFFPDQTSFPSRELDTKLISRAYSHFKMADWRGEKRYVIHTSKNHSSVQKVESTMFSLISLSLYGTSCPRKYSIFIQQLSLFHFRKIFFLKPVRLGPCRETARNDKKSWNSRQNRESWQVWCSEVSTIKCYQNLSISRKKHKIVKR